MTGWYNMDGVHLTSQGEETEPGSEKECDSIDQSTMLWGASQQLRCFVTDLTI